MTDEPQRLILIVEDDRGVATLQRRRLQRAHFGVMVASDVDEAIRVLEGHRVDLVVLDYRLGPTTGLDLHRRMKASGFDVPVIIVSGSMDDAMVIEAIRAGVRDVVVKNADYLDYLSDAVRSVLEQTATVPPASRQDPHRTRVLIVEDDQNIATLERRQLQRVGYHVEVASNADAAMDIVRGGTTDLVLLDLRLGDSTGLELYDRFKSEGFNVPAILITAFADQSVAIRALRAGVRDFIPKSGDFLEHLPNVVERVIAQVRVERKLVESELRLASIIGTTMDAILMCDADARLVLFNRSAEEMFGCTAHEAIDQPVTTFLPQLCLDTTVGAHDSGNLRRRLELQGRHYSGAQVPIEVTISDMVVHGSRLFTVIARDISERKRIESELRDADRRKDEFLGMLAHELRNPLAAIMTAGEVLNRTVPDPQAQKLTAVVRRQTKALARMVDDLLDVSRVTMGKIQLAAEPLLLGEAVTRAADTAREAMARQGIKFEVQVDRDPIWLNGDATRLEQVFSNLLNNAMKFTPAGGRVTLEVKSTKDEAVIRLRDSGIGIPPHVLPRIFDLFMQADTSLDRAKSGLGIGLALVRQLVALHGGSVTARSEGPGTGAEFVVRLPLLQDEALAASEDPVGPGRDGDNATLRVVVVDDQRDVADAVAMLVESLGHDVRAVYDGRTALTVCRSQRPDVMFIDVGMPGMTGYDLARRIRDDARLARTHLVALTGYGREEDRARAEEAGFELHVTKPLGEPRLREVLSRLNVTV